MKGVVVLAFDEPPGHWGFKRSRKGTSWWIKIAPERVPRCLQALKSLGIGAKAHYEPYQETKNPRPSPSTMKGKGGRNRPRGKAARADFDKRRHDDLDHRYIERASKTAEATAATARVVAIKEARVRAEAKTRRRELAKQRQQTLDRDQHNEARRAAELYLLNHPAGSA